MIKREHDAHKTPPVDRRWRNVYIAVVAFLLLQIALYYIFMNYFG
jgi:hypothetical protein